MEFVVMLNNGEAHSFDTQPTIVTFYNQTRTPIAAFSGWISVKPEQPQGV
jgi:hypothetical protein